MQIIIKMNAEENTITLDGTTFNRSGLKKEQKDEMAKRISNVWRVEHGYQVRN